MSIETRAPYIYGAIAAALLAMQILVLHSFGQPAFAASGHFRMWVGDPFSPDTSQQLADWYSFSHIIHGFIFYGLLQLAAPRTPFALRLLIAMGVEIAWEISENTPAVIEHYRQQALAIGYRGDTIFNSLSDTAMMAAGFFIASRAKARYVIAVAVALELFTLLFIRDNLTLNVINLIAPSDWAPIKAIHDWQAGAKPWFGANASDGCTVQGGTAESVLPSNECATAAPHATVSS
jgi:hypothetical protein